MTASTIEIGRITISAGPRSEAEARRLARLIGEALAQWPIESGSIGRLAVTAHASGTAPVEQLAGDIVASIHAAAQAAGLR
jgi:hypothetical protein